MAFHINPDGKRVAYGTRFDDNKAYMLIDGKKEGPYDRVGFAIFSPDSKNVAAKVKRNGKYNIILNDRLWRQECEAVWDPVFSPDGQKVLVRTIEDGTYYRRIITTAELAR